MNVVAPSRVAQRCQVLGVLGRGLVKHAAHAAGNALARPETAP